VVGQGWLAFKIGEGRRGNGGTAGRQRWNFGGRLGTAVVVVVVVACFMRVWLFLNSDVGIWRGSLR
jgi:hypothetical protein